MRHTLAIGNGDSGIMQDETVVSSSNIRRFLLQGQVEQAARLLGRYYAIEAPL